MKLTRGLLICILLSASSAWGMSIELFHKWVNPEWKMSKTTKELVEGYDKLICLAHRQLADGMLKHYLNKTINELRNELVALAQGPQGATPAPAEEDEDWGI